ncbi:hypothetical protein ACFLWH_01065 [Chloroflexota bacterium]
MAGDKASIQGKEEAGYLGASGFKIIIRQPTFTQPYGWDIDLHIKPDC